MRNPLSHVRRYPIESAATVAGLILFAVSLFQMAVLLSGASDLRVNFQISDCHGATNFYPRWVVSQNNDLFLYISFSNCAEAAIFSTQNPNYHAAVNDHDGDLEIDESTNGWTAKVETFDVLSKELSLVLGYKQPFGRSPGSKSIRLYGNGSAIQVGPGRGTAGPTTFWPSLWVDAHHTVSSIVPTATGVSVTDIQTVLFYSEVVTELNDVFSFDPSDDGLEYSFDSQNNLNYVVGFDLNSASRTDRDFLLIIWTTMFGLGLSLFFEAIFSLLRSVRFNRRKLPVEGRSI
ncbi:hypothetical protein [Mesorhizobium sp. KR9-304]|uniref:hypothetical protein n=1 Tax=Mesorhizobium sp. KR9-304 TaxID=3156614 RepID=UPI0032B60B5D